MPFNVLAGARARVHCAVYRSPFALAARATHTRVETGEYDILAALTLRFVEPEAEVCGLEARAVPDKRKVRIERVSPQHPNSHQMTYAAKHCWSRCTRYYFCGRLPPSLC